MHPRSLFGLALVSLLSAHAVACSSAPEPDGEPGIRRITAASTDALGPHERLALDLSEPVVYRFDPSSGPIELGRIDFVVDAAPRAVLDAVPARVLAAVEERVVDLAGDRALFGALGEGSNDATQPQPQKKKYECVTCDDGVCWVEFCAP